MLPLGRIQIKAEKREILNPVRPDDKIGQRNGGGHRRIHRDPGQTRLQIDPQSGLNGQGAEIERRGRCRRAKKAAVGVEFDIASHQGLACAPAPLGKHQAAIEAVLRQRQFGIEIEMGFDDSRRSQLEKPGNRIFHRRRS